MENSTRALIEAVKQLVKFSDVKIILLHIDSLSQLTVIEPLSGIGQLIVSTSEPEVADHAKHYIENVLFTVSKHPSRLGELKHAVLFAALAGLLKKDDKVICVSSTSRKKPVDLLALLDLSKELQILETQEVSKIAERIPHEVIEPLFHIATELSEEGREGLPIGTMFVIGDSSKVENYSRQLILNPFRGYPKGERNIVDLSIKETVKSFSQLDGAFILKSDGTILSAGSYLDVPSEEVQLPPGLGTRHRAASAITSKTKAIAVVVSRSGAIRIFKDGKIVLAVERR